MQAPQPQLVSVSEECVLYDHLAHCYVVPRHYAADFRLIQSCIRAGTPGERQYEENVEMFYDRYLQYEVHEEYETI